MDLGSYTYSPLAANVLPLALIAGLSWILLRAFIKLRVSPLSKFPGPKWAALTNYWHAIVECVLNRSFLDVLIDLHEKHGSCLLCTSETIQHRC